MTTIRNPDTCPGESPVRDSLPKHDIGAMPDRCAVCADLLARARADARAEGEAWARLHDAVARLPGWGVGPCQFHADDQRWHVTAVDLAPRGRRARREAIEATGPTEVAALDALVETLEGRASQR